MTSKRHAEWDFNPTEPHCAYLYYTESDNINFTLLAELPYGSTGGITEVSVDFLEREFDGQTTERESRIMR